MRIRPRVLLAKYLVSSTVQFLDDEGSAYSSYILPGYDSKLIWFKTHMIQNSYDSNGYDSNGYDSNGYIWFKRVLLKLSEYTVSSYSAHGASCTLSIWFSLHLRREIHGVGSNGMWWTYWVSKGAMDSVHVRTRAPHTLRIHRISYKIATDTPKYHITFIMMIGMMLTYGHTI